MTWIKIITECFGNEKIWTEKIRFKCSRYFYEKELDELAHEKIKTFKEEHSKINNSKDKFFIENILKE